MYVNSKSDVSVEVAPIRKHCTSCTKTAENWANAQTRYLNSNTQRNYLFEFKKCVQTILITI